MGKKCIAQGYKSKGHKSKGHKSKGYKCNKCIIIKKGPTGDSGLALSPLTLTALRDADPSNNIYNAWPELYDRLKTQPRPTTVYIEGTFPQAVITTSGTFDLEGVRFEGAYESDSSGNISSFSVLRVGPNTVFENASYFNNVALVFQSDVPAITLPYAPTPLGTQFTAIHSSFSNDTTTFGRPPTVSPIQIPDGDSTAITMINSDISNFAIGSPPVVDVGVGSSLFVDALGTTRITSIPSVTFALGGAGTYNFSSGSDTAVTPLPQGATVTFFPRDGYHVGNPADWVGAPTTLSIDAALDRIAAAIGPI